MSVVVRFPIFQRESVSFATKTQRSAFVKQMVIKESPSISSTPKFGWPWIGNDSGIPDGKGTVDGSRAEAVEGVASTSTEVGYVGATSIVISEVREGRIEVGVEVICRVPSGTGV